MEKKTREEMLNEVLLNTNLSALERAVAKTEFSMDEVLDSLWGAQNA